MSKIGEINSKKDLNSHLFAMRQAAIYDVFAQICLHENIKKIHRGESDYFKLKQTLPEGELDFVDFLNNLVELGGDAPVETKRNANRFLTRNHLKEVFRVTQAYCKKTDQIKLMKSESWYQFARVITNSLSHDFKLNFNDYDKKILPVSYGEKEITSGMDGKCLELALEVLLKLSDEIINFSKTKITK